MNNIEERLVTTREKAKQVVPGRRDMQQLYTILAECLSLCEDIDREGRLEEFKEKYKSLYSKGTSRKYFESRADSYLVVCRFVFEQEKRRDACWRYTAALREAAKRQISSAHLIEWLKFNGGISTLFIGRNEGKTVSTDKTLHLNRPINTLLGQAFTVTLRRDNRGRFDVLDIKAKKEN